MEAGSPTPLNYIHFSQPSSLSPSLDNSGVSYHLGLPSPQLYLQPAGGQHHGILRRPLLPLLRAGEKVGMAVFKYPDLGREGKSKGWSEERRGGRGEGLQEISMGTKGKRSERRRAGD